AKEPTPSASTTRADDSVDTTRIPARPNQPTEAKTTRFAAQGAPGRDRPAEPRPPAKPSPPAPQAPQRPPTAPPSGDQTRAIPVPGNRPDDPDNDAPGDAVNPRGQGENGDPARQRRRSGGGLSAADLLRREGRL
ncbi:hypothetical protein JF723_25145, partial [Mycobacterium intracellulare]|nr:hypothetical protein [Mycobacterium intracellulare]